MQLTWANGTGFNATATPPFIASVENGSPMAVCAAFPPNAGFATDAAVPGKYEPGWGACNVAQFAGLAPGASAEWNAHSFAVLVASPRLVWGAPPPAAPPADAALGAALGPVSYPRASVNGSAVFACRAYHPTARPVSGPHAGYFKLGGPCTFSWGGTAVTNAGFDAVYLMPANSAAAPPSATPLPSASASPSIPAPSPSASASSSPAVAGAPELWLDRASALALGYSPTSFLQSGSDWSDPIYVCRGVLPAGFTGPTPSASASASPIALFSAAPTPSAAPVALALAGAAPLPGAANAVGLGAEPDKLDHMDLYAAPSGARLLFVAVKQNNSLAVVDAGTLTFNASIGGLQGPSGVKVVPQLGLVLVTAQGEGALYAFSLAAPYTRVWSVKGLENADNLAFDAATGLAWVSAGGTTFAGGLYAVSATTGLRVGAGIPFGASVTTAPPQDFRLSGSSSLVYACSPATNEIVVASRTSMQVVARWSLASCCGASDPNALEIDSAGGRLFVATYGTSPGPAFGSKMLFALNLYDGAAVFNMSTPTAECNQVTFDARTGAVFVSCGGSAAAGAQSVVYGAQQLGASSYAALGAQTALPAGLFNARTSVYDAASGTLFVGVPFVAATGQAARVLALNSGRPGAPVPASPWALREVLPGRYDYSSWGGGSSCLVPFDTNNAGYGAVAYQMLVRSPFLTWSSSFGAGGWPPAGARAVLSGAVGGRNATVCRAWFMCDKTASPWCANSGPHAGYALLDGQDGPGVAPACVYTYYGAGTVLRSSSFDVLYALPGAAPTPLALALPSASVTPSTSPSPSPSMNASVPGVLQWIPGGTSDAVFAGMDGSTTVSVCRGQVGTELVPGKRLGNSNYCDVAVRGAELLDATFASLRNNARLQWVAGNATAAFEAAGFARVDGGTYQGVRATVCRALHSSGSGPHSGFTDGLSYAGRQLCFFSWGGMTMNSLVFDVLYSAPGPSPSATPSRTPSPTTTPVTASPTPSKTPSAPPPSPTRTPTNTRTPSQTATPTRTVTRTPTGSITPTASMTVGASRTSTTSITPSVSGSLAPPAPIDAGLYITDPKTGGASGVVLAFLAIGSVVALVAAAAVVFRRAPPSSSVVLEAAGGASAESERQALSSALEFGSASDARFAYDALAPQR